MIDIQKDSSSWSSFEMSSADDPSVPTELLQSLRQHALFQRTNNESFLEQVACSMHLRTYSPRDVIIVEGEIAKAMFFLLRGSVDVCSADFERIYATLPKGSCFGEIGILYSMPRTATVIARSKCVVAALTAEEVNTLLPQYPQVEKMLRFEAEERLSVLAKSKRSLKERGKMFTERNIEDLTSARQFLQRIPYFQTCPEHFLHSIALNVEPRHYAPLDLILQKGSHVNEIFFILSGTVEITNVDTPTSDSTTPVARYGEGDYFGDIAILLHRPCPADVQAVTAVEVYVLKKTHFMQALSYFPDRHSQLKEMAEKKFTRLKFNSSVVRPPDAVSMICVDESPKISLGSVCSTTSDQDPTIIHSTLLNESESFGRRKRRDSVAVWSDPHLVALANKHIHPAKKKEIIRQFEPLPLIEGRLMSLPHSVLEGIVRELDVMSVMEFSRVSKKSREFIQHNDKILHTVDLSPFHKKVTDTMLAEMVIGKHVRHLNLSQCFYITDQGIMNLLDKVGEHLETLDLNSCWLITDLSLSLLGKSCPHLTHLDLSNCRKISDIGIFRLLDEKQTHNYAPLKHLSLSYCKKVSDTLMMHLAEYCSNSLESLNLQRCTRISDEGFSYWADRQFPLLHTLNLTDCSFLTDQTISNLVNAAPHLSHLTLSFCCALSDVAIETLRVLTELRELDASFCGAAVSDLSIHQLMQSSCPLVSLNIRGCVRITDLGIQSILHSNHILHTLNISQCPCITYNTKQSIRESGIIHHFIA